MQSGSMSARERPCEKDSTCDGRVSRRERPPSQNRPEFGVSDAPVSMPYRVLMKVLFLPPKDFAVAF